LWIVSAANSFACDYIARQKTPGSHLNVTIFSQLPIPVKPTDGFIVSHVLPRALELTYVIGSLSEFARDCGYDGPPFRWDEERRFLLRCELDAAFFHLYLGSEDEWRRQPEALTRAFPTPRDAVAYIMDTFPIVKRKDEAAYGEYRTKLCILDLYDAMAEAIHTGVPFQSELNPPPADPQCCHPLRGKYT
jgi:hypothetical protein